MIVPKPIVLTIQLEIKELKNLFENYI